MKLNENSICVKIKPVQRRNEITLGAVLNMQGADSCLPCGKASPGTMFVCQDVDDLLDELHGRHVVTVLGCPDQVVTHPLLFPLVRRVLGTRGLASKTERNTLHILQTGSSVAPRKCTFQYITTKMCDAFIHGNCGVSKTK